MALTWLMLLLAAALFFSVTFPGGAAVQVPLSDPGPEDLFTEAQPTVSLNRSRSAAVVRRCVFGPVNADWCDLMLVRANGEVQTLWRPRGIPGQVWTVDGRYVVAWNDASLRLWNLRGQVRGVMPDLPLTSGQRMFGRDIRKVWFHSRAQMH